MVKERRSPLGDLATLAHLAALAACAACASAPLPPRPGDFAPRALPGFEAFRPADGAAQVRASAAPLWSYRATGLITDIDVSQDGSTWALSTAPNAEDEDSEPGFHLALLDGAGKLRWKRRLEAGVRDLAIARDGSAILVSDYENELHALDRAGGVLWSAEAFCKPISLSGGRFLCYHDDDGDPGAVFDVYSRRGRKELTYRAEGDVLALKVSGDGRNVAVALTGGRLVLFAPAPSRRWERRIDGELSDVAVSSGKAPRVAALVDARPGGPGQRLLLYSAAGELIASAEPSAHATAVEISPDGEGAASAGSGSKGRYLGYFALKSPAPPEGSEAFPTQLPPLQPRLTEIWRRAEDRAADDAPSLLLADGLVVTPYEDNAGGSRGMRFLAFGREGGLRHDLALGAPEGANLGAHAIAPTAALLGAATDDGVLRVFTLKTPSGQ